MLLLYYYLFVLIFNFSLRERKKEKEKHEVGWVGGEEDVEELGMEHNMTKINSMNFLNIKHTQKIIFSDFLKHT